MVAASVGNASHLYREVRDKEQTTQSHENATCGNHQLFRQKHKYGRDLEEATYGIGGGDERKEQRKKTVQRYQSEKRPGHEPQLII